MGLSKHLREGQGASGQPGRCIPGRTACDRQNRTLKIRIRLKLDSGEPGRKACPGGDDACSLARLHQEKFACELSAEEGTSDRLQGCQVCLHRLNDDPASLENDKGE